MAVASQKMTLRGEGTWGSARSELRPYTQYSGASCGPTHNMQRGERSARRNGAHLMRFLLRMRGALTDAPTMDEPVIKMPLHAAATLLGAAATERRCRQPGAPFDAAPREQHTVLHTLLVAPARSSAPPPLGRAARRALPAPRSRLDASAAQAALRRPTPAPRAPRRRPYPRPLRTTIRSHGSSSRAPCRADDAERERERGAEVCKRERVYVRKHVTPVLVVDARRHARRR